MRCRHETLLNSDRVCRACAIDIRSGEGELEEILSGARRFAARDLQLALVLEGVKTLQAQPVRKPRTASASVRCSARPETMDRDDPAVCTPQIPGQIAWVRIRRTLTFEHAKRVAARDFAELPRLTRVVEELGVERSRSRSWGGAVVGMVCLALAARDPDDQLVHERDLAQLPDLRGTVAEVLRRAGLLHARSSAWPVALHPPRKAWGSNTRKSSARGQLSCEDCLCWTGGADRVCSQCRSWNRTHPRGPCTRCGRVLALSLGRCRLCHLVLQELSVNDMVGADQLWLGTVWVRRSGEPGRALKALRRRREREQREARLISSPHLIDPNQLELFPAPPRDWRAIPAPERLRLTPVAERLVDELDQLARAQSWGARPRKDSLRTLRILAGWLGAEAPFGERDVQDLARLGPGFSALRLAGFLRSRNLLIAQHDTDTQQAAIQRLVGDVPDQFRPGVKSWIAVLRGEGRHPSRVMPWATIRSYLNAVLAALTAWKAIASFSEITPGQVTKAIESAHHHVALRSLFRALKRERLIFRDPARGVRHVPTRSLPRPIPSDRLQGLLEHATNPKDRFALFLIAVHAMRPGRIGTLVLTDLNRSNGRLRVVAAHGVRTLHLDEFGLLLAKEMLRERHRRWPLSTNPHLLVSATTAMHPDNPPISFAGFRTVLERAGLNATQLRRDRLLDEAHHTADPVQLMRLFGISSMSALDYVRAAHPDQFTVDPTEA